MSFQQKLSASCCVADPNAVTARATAAAIAIKRSNKYVLFHKQQPDSLQKTELPTAVTAAVATLAQELSTGHLSKAETRTCSQQL